MAWLYKLLNENGKQSELHNIAEYIISAVICLNIVLIIFESSELGSDYGLIIGILRWAFFAFFLIEYILRLCIADLVMNDKLHPVKSRIRYIFTPRALINLFALLPVLLGGTIIDFRIFRALRLLRITQIKSLQKQTNILIKVLKLKGTQLLASLFIVFISMLVSGVIICDLESKVQPDVFNNILKGFWWAVSAFTTIGYGDIYPISPAGKIFGSFVSIFGIFLMAIPIGILTSGFFEISKKADPEQDDIE
jgi:voltage-gated potassium channel